MIKLSKEVCGIIKGASHPHKYFCLRKVFGPWIVSFIVFSQLSAVAAIRLDTNSQAVLDWVVDEDGPMGLLNCLDICHTIIC